MSVQLLEWKVSTGQLEGFDPDTLEHRCSITSTPDGWLLVIHGSALNDEGTAYQWSRQELDQAGAPVLQASVGEARARAEQLAPEYVATHEASEAERRKQDAKANLTAQRSAVSQELDRVDAELAAGGDAP